MKYLGHHLLVKMSLINHKMFQQRTTNMLKPNNYDSDWPNYIKKLLPKDPLQYTLPQVAKECTTGFQCWAGDTKLHFLMRDQLGPPLLITVTLFVDHLWPIWHFDKWGAILGWKRPSKHIKKLDEQNVNLGATLGWKRLSNLIRKLDEETDKPGATLGWKRPSKHNKKLDEQNNNPGATLGWKRLS